MSAVSSCGKLIGQFLRFKVTRNWLFGASFVDFWPIFVGWHFGDCLATCGQLFWRLYGDSSGDFSGDFFGWLYGDYLLWWLLGDSSFATFWPLSGNYLATCLVTFCRVLTTLWCLFPQFSHQLVGMPPVQTTWQVSASKVVQTRVLTPTVDGRSPADLVNISVCAERFIHVRWFVEISEPSTVRKAFRPGTFEDKLVP